jgi:hypothetical protein
MKKTKYTPRAAKNRGTMLLHAEFRRYRKQLYLAAQTRKSSDLY